MSKKDFSLDAMEVLKVPMPPPIVPKPQTAERKTEPETVHKAASEVVSSLVFTPKSKDGRQASFYLQKDVVDKIDAAAKDSGVSRSVWLETLLNQVL